MEQLEEIAANAEMFEDLHEAIGEGDLERVKLNVKSHGNERFFSLDGTSALYKAFQCKNYDIISFLIHIGAKFVGSEEKYVYSFDIDLDRVNRLLFDYNKKTERSCVYRIMSVSQSPQVLNGERLNAIASMYEYLLGSNIIKLLIKVLERVDFDIVFDFESDKINRVHRLYEEEAEVFGLTLTTVREIFIGAKDLLSRDHMKRSKVYGVVAEELCHLALTIVYQNDAKAYREEDSELIQEFRHIVIGVKSLIARSCHTESVILDVYRCYNGYHWECELIARVPHVIGMYGEECGRRILKESSELYRLLTFYENNVLPKCREYTDPSLNRKPHREMEQIVMKDYISFKEKQIEPLNGNVQSFRRYLVEWESVSVITTNCTKLCTLHVYHELKKEYKDLVEKKCLFFTRKSFEKEIYKIRDALKGNLWEYIILVMDKKELNSYRFQAEFLDHLEASKGMKLIMISSTQSTDEKFDFEKAVNYKWSDLSEEFKTILQGVKYIFKGEEEVTYVGKECFPKFFNDDEISIIISGELTEVDDGKELFSQGYVPETYIEREFCLTVVDDEIFKNVSPDTSIFLSGLRKAELGKLPINKNQVQWLIGYNDEIQSGKSIFVANKDTEMSFGEFRKRNCNKSNIWLHFDERDFNVRAFDSSGDVFSQHMKQKTLSEVEILSLLKRRKTVIICDNAGYGKSTVISKLIDNLKRHDYRSWNWRINFNKFSADDKNPLSLANVEENSSDEDVLDYLFLMLGLKNGLERLLFRKLGKDGHCFIFFDGFDEIPSEFISNAMKLLFTVRKRTDANMIVSTRKHHQEELEQLLNIYSHQLVPLSKKDQVGYLEKLWRSKLKYPYGRGTLASQNDRKRVLEKIKKIVQESEEGKTNLDYELHDLIIAMKEIKLDDGLESVRLQIDDLKFGKLAKTVIEKTSLDKETLQLMGIPLHLFIVGSIYLDCNFIVEIDSDIYGIYSKFIDQKILVYLEEKQEITRGKEKQKLFKQRRKDAYRIHIELCNQLKDKVFSNMDEEDMELCTALGIIFIKGSEIDFLHHTFAEFFKTESIRWNLNKDVLIEVLFDAKYDVVRRFLSSALLKSNFENLTKEFFEDVDFVFPLLNQFLCEDMEFELGMVELNSHLANVARIVKCLLEAFEETADEHLLNAFVVKLESKLSLLTKWYRVGGCLTVKILKALFHRNLKDNFKMMFGVVRHYSNPEEVIDVLSDCISIETELNDGESESLLKFLKFHDSDEMGILYFAISNMKAEVLANILKFTKCTLGEEKFINAVVQSGEYRTVMSAFIENVDFNTIGVLLKAFHSTFDKAIEVFFDADLKFSILRKTVYIGDGSSDSFEEGFRALQEYFGIETVKQILLSSDYGGHNLIHYLVSKKRSPVEYLKVIRNILDDKTKMEEILKSENWMSRNVFHFAVENRNVNFGEIVRFGCENVETEGVKELILRSDQNGWNVLHLLFKHNSPEVLIENLNVIKGTFNDEGLFKRLLKEKDRELNNILHLSAKNKRGRKSKIYTSLVDFHLSKSEMKDLLIGRDKNGRTSLHCVAFYDSTNLPFLLDFSCEILKDDESQFEELILAEDLNGNTFLHLFLAKFYIYNSHDFESAIIESLMEKLSHDDFKKLLRIRNKKGETFLQMKSFGSKGNIECLKTILGEDFFDELSQTNE